MARTRLLMGALLLCAVANAGCRSIPIGGGSAGAEFPFVVTEEERGLALELLGETENFRIQSSAGHAYLVGIEVLNEKEAEDDRVLLVTHYRTEGDLAIVSRVNLTQQRVASVEPIPHLPVRLSAEEFELAKKLALDRKEVADLLGGRDVKIEALVSRASNAADPLFGHRVLHLLFRTPQGYLETRVMVDLTTRDVTIERGEEGNR